jgi:hypothetical protein
LVEQLDDLVVHRPARLRVRMEDQRDGRTGTRPRMETAYQAALGTRENDFGHGLCGCSRKDGLLSRRVHGGGGFYIGAGVQQAIGRYPPK